MRKLKDYKLLAFSNSWMEKIDFRCRGRHLSLPCGEATVTLEYEKLTFKNTFHVVCVATLGDPPNKTTFLLHSKN